MIQADAFVQELRRVGFKTFSGTPCSYLTPLINQVIDCPETAYIGAANEGDAVAIACGGDLGGRPGVILFQNSGLGNAVNPLTSLTYPFRIPVLLLVTWRGQPNGSADEPQHELMGAITQDLLKVMRIPFEEVSPSVDQLAPMIQRATNHMRETRIPFALVLPHGIIGPYSLQTKQDPFRLFEVVDVPRGRTGPPLDQDAVLSCIQSSVRPTDAVLATTGYTGRALYALADRPNQFYMVGSMGCVSSLGLGLARSQPQRRVVVLDGDGAVLMRMGALATLGHERPDNLLHVVLDNGVHDSTGGQATVSASTDLAGVASACGYPRVVRISSLDELRQEMLSPPGKLTLLHLRTRPRASTKLPRPSLTPAQFAERFRHWLRETA